MRVGHLVVGPDQHGVVSFALGLARDLGGPVLRAPDAGTAQALSAGSAPDADIVHLQFTDALFADRCDIAAERFVQLRNTVRGPASVTLHDLPDPADDPGRYARRARAYRRVASAVDVVVVSSSHESGLLDQVLGRPARAGVVPLPVAPRAPRAGRRTRTGEIGLLGFVHPGKGYGEALAELAAYPDPLIVTAVGRAADGHEDLPGLLRSVAERSGHRWRMTGFLPESRLTGGLQEVAVPLAPNPRVSASGSVNSWLAAGRRPLVADGGYARELGTRMPDAITVYRPGELAAAVARAVVDPGSTWLDDEGRTGADGPATARAYRRVLAAAC